MRQPLRRIGELAEQVGLTADALRYYERLGILSPTARSSGGYRLYNGDADERLAFVRKAQALGLTLAEVRQIVDLAAGGRAPCAHVRRTLEGRLNALDDRIIELRSLRRTIVRLVGRDHGRLRAGPCICAIIESAPSARRHAPSATRHAPRTARR